MPALSQMGLVESLKQIQELSGWFFRNLSAGVRDVLVKDLLGFKLYPFFVLQVLLLSQDSKLVENGLEILVNLSALRPD